MNEHSQSRPSTTTGVTTAASVGSPELPVDMSHVTTTYVNYFHACGSPRELILDFGLQSGLRMSSGPEPIHVTQRLIMPMLTAKQLLEFLQMLIRTQENAYGPMQVTPLRPNPQTGNPPTS